VIEKYKLYYHPKKEARMNRKRRQSVKRKRITELKAKPLTGLLLCMDTIVVYWNSTKRYIFTAVDKHAKIAFARMYTTKSSRNAQDFLYRLHHLLDGKIENVGHDNGSEFRGLFAETCQKLEIQQYVSRIKTPKDNAIRWSSTIPRPAIWRARSAGGGPAGVRARAL
jgi:IS30 family transposase